VSGEFVDAGSGDASSAGDATSIAQPALDGGTTDPAVAFGPEITIASNLDDHVSR